MRWHPSILPGIIFLAATVLRAESAAIAPARQMIRVNNATELIAAIGSDRVIQLSPGDYDIGKVQHKTTHFVRWGETASVADDGDADAGIVSPRPLIIRHVENMSLECAGEKPVRILTDIKFVPVMTFNDVRNIQLKNVQILHVSEQKHFDSSVVVVNDCHDVTLDHCLVSNGVGGLTLSEVDGFLFKHSTISNCEHWILKGYELKNIQCVDSSFTENKISECGMEFNKSADVSFFQCTISNNTLHQEIEHDVMDHLIISNNFCTLVFNGCVIKGNDGEASFCGGGGGDKVGIKDCIFADNRFPAPKQKTPK